MNIFEEERYYADLIIPVPIPRLYTYSIPKEFENKVALGCRVIIQFGTKKLYTSIIANIHKNKPKIYETKPILEVLDEVPSMNNIQLQLISWMAEYYMCSPGEVMNAALPSGLKIHNKSKIQLHPFYREGEIPLTDNEERIVQSLKSRDDLAFEDIATLLGKKTILPIIKSLVQKNVIIIYEEIKEKFNPKKIKKIRLNESYNNKEALEQLFKDLEKKAPQTELLLKYLKHVPVLREPANNKAGIEKNKLTDPEKSDSPLKTLIKKDIFQEFEEIVSRFEPISDELLPIPTLSEEQQKAKENILEIFKTKDSVLLHGITGSGKTEIFIQLIQEALDSGTQVLYMLPEIALTTQMVNRLRKIFGSGMGIYHSKFSDNERVEMWNGIISGKFNFILGVRSSIFLPFDNLGLIIIDEEHETSYKQQEPNPRYHARDTALMLAKLHHSKVILGSATPSIETYHQCMLGNRGLVTLKKRFGNTALPEIILADLKREKKFKTIKNDFSSLMYNHIKENLEKKEQVIVFRNRRGYTPYISCDDCAYVFRCVNCDVSLTYHQYNKELRCHYCGYKETVFHDCPACGSAKIISYGFGTEKIEEDLQLFFPGASIDRMDTDSTRKKNSYEEIIKNLEEGKTDILVGTQMISKGFDFNKVTLVGIMDADNMLFYPDFRSFERTFQILTQVSGRAGRRDKQGKVIIQTKNPGQRIFQWVIENDYDSLYKEEITERKQYNYPPFVRLIKISLRHVDKSMTEKAAKKLAVNLKTALGAQRIIGPEWPIIDKLRNKYIMDIIIKLEKGKVNYTYAKALIKKETEAFSFSKDYKDLQIIHDVDPI